MKRRAYVYAACALLLVTALYLTNDSGPQTGSPPKNLEQVTALQNVLPPQSYKSIDNQDPSADLQFQPESDADLEGSIEEVSVPQVNELDQDLEMQVQVALDAGVITPEQREDFRKERLSLMALQTEETYLSSIDEFPES